MIMKQAVVVVALVAGKTDEVEAAAATWGEGRGGGACLWCDDTRLRVKPVQQLELSGSRVTTSNQNQKRKNEQASLMCLLVETSCSPSTHT